MASERKFLSAMKYTKKDVLTVPNFLSLLRLMLIPVFAFLYMRAESTKDYIISASVFAFSALTDAVDGFIARKCNMRSRLGIMLDPFADKMTQGVIMLCLTIKQKELLPLLILFIIKEAFMLTMGCFNLKKGRMLDGALFTGKLCTTVIFLGMIAIMVLRNMPFTALHITVTVCSLFMVVSLVSYVLCYFGNSPHIKDIESEKEDTVN